MVMSALPPKADMCSALILVRYGLPMGSLTMESANLITEEYQYQVSQIPGGLTCREAHVSDGGQFRNIACTVRLSFNVYSPLFGISPSPSRVNVAFPTGTKILNV